MCGFGGILTGYKHTSQPALAREGGHRQHAGRVAHFAGQAQFETVVVRLNEGVCQRGPLISAGGAGERFVDAGR
mgnify:CR=1 FL=1